MLVLQNFSVFRGSTPIVAPITFSFRQGSTTIITGNNGSGKSTLASALMGLSGFHTQGNIFFNGLSIAEWSVEQRARSGFFFVYQYPLEIPGLGIKTFLQHAYRACKGTDLTVEQIDKKIGDSFAFVGLPQDYCQRNVHEGFSGGQKKRLELVQLLVLEPRVIILDELDSGLDAQGIQTVTHLIDYYKKLHPETIFIIITHNPLLVMHEAVDNRLFMESGAMASL